MNIKKQTSNPSIIDLIATGNNIKNLRISSGFSVANLKNELSLCSVQAIYKWQSGITLPSVDNLAAMAKLFNVKIDDIIIRR